MRVFVAGGTGVLGRRVVPALVEQGHEVTAVVRSPAKAAAVEAAGARPVDVGLFDPDGLRAAVAGHQAVVNLATNIPPFAKAARRKAWATNDRIRREGSRNLVDAALAAGAERYVQESVCFLYEDGGDRWLDESAPLRPTWATASAAVAEGEAARFDRSGDGVATVLRFGSFYGPDAVHLHEMAKLARRGMSPVPGRPDAYVSPVALDDAASAVAAVLATPAGAVAGTFNVADDEPLTRAEFAAVLAEVVGRERLRPMPAVLFRLLRSRIDSVSRSQRLSNRRLREATRWSPTVPSAREGFPLAVRAAARA